MASPLRPILERLEGLAGLEIGGPSPQCFGAQKIYDALRSCDNVNFALTTVWGNHDPNDFRYGQRAEQCGKQIKAEATDLYMIATGKYDCVLSSHNLEHVANPLKAVAEWVRVVRPGGYLLLILPDKKDIFDRYRPDTTFGQIHDKYLRNVGEDNLESLPEILRLHDLKLDPPAGTLEQFTRRSLDNLNNRCLHHHVFSLPLVQDICRFFRLEMKFHHTESINMWFLLQTGPSIQ